MSMPCARLAKALRALQKGNTAEDDTRQVSVWFKRRKVLNCRIILYGALYNHLPRESASSDANCNIAVCTRIKAFHQRFYSNSAVFNYIALHAGLQAGYFILWQKRKKNYFLRVDIIRISRIGVGLMKKYNVGVVGATGMVGQRFVSLLENHPWFTLVAVAASPRSAGKTYEQAVGARWAMPTPMPNAAKNLIVMDASDVAGVAAKVDFVFCAVDMKKEEIKALEEAYAKAECPVISNNSAHRFTKDVPMIVPEINAEHTDIIPMQKQRLGTKRGFIAVKSNCSLQSYVPALHPLMQDFGVSKCLVCTYQAISGAGKTFETWPEMMDNCIPFIGGEEEKSEKEPLKLWGKIAGDAIVPADGPAITAQCLRVACTDGHMAAVFVSFDKKPTIEEIKAKWATFKGEAQNLSLPSAPKQFLHYFEEENRPQTKLDRNVENGMAVSIGRLREDTQYDYKFVCLSHNTLRGAAGGAVLLAELLAAKGYLE